MSKCLWAKLLVAAAIAAPVVAGAQEVEWTPLTKNLGSELGEKWVPVPDGESGAPRQGWLATADGFFTREAHLAYSYTDRQGSEAHEALARFHLPLSRRLWAGVTLPFYQESRGVSGVGDATLTTQVMLAEARNLSLNAGVGWRLPIGARRTGNGVFAAQPQINLWTDIGSGFSLRGRLAYEFANRGEGEAFVLNAALGQTVTRHDAAPLGDLTWYVAGNLRAPNGNRETFVSVTPGARTHLSNNLFLLAGVEIPVAGQSSSFRERFIVQLVQGF